MVVMELPVTEINVASMASAMAGFGSIPSSNFSM